MWQARGNVTSGADSRLVDPLEEQALRGAVMDVIVASSTADGSHDPNAIAQSVSAVDSIVAGDCTRETLDSGAAVIAAMSTVRLTGSNGRPAAWPLPRC